MLVIPVIIPFLTPRRVAGTVMSGPRDSHPPISVHKTPRFASEFASVAELTHLLASSFSTRTYTYLNLHILTSLLHLSKQIHT